MTFSTFASPGVSLQGGGGSGGGAASLPISGNGATVTASTPLVDGTQTWNNGAVTFTGLKFNATDTASASGSLLMDLQVGGTSKFKVDKIGAVNATLLTATNAVDCNIGARLFGINGGSLILGGASTGGIYFTPTTNQGSTPDLILTRRAAANLRFGAADAAAPVAQTLSVQSVVAGTTNTAGTNLTITGSQGTGTGAGGSIIFQVAPAGSSGSAQNALATALTIGSDSTFTIGGTNPAIIGPGNTGRITFSGSNASLCYGGVNNTFGIALISPNGGSNTNLVVHSVGTIGFSSTSNANAVMDIILARDAAATLALRNGANAQAFRVYNTFTDATTFERANIFWDSNVLKIGTEKGSVGGTARNFELQTDGTTRLTISTTGSATFTSNLFVGASSILAWTGRSRMYSSASGTIQLGNSDNNGFDLLQFGGTDATFPALKRSSTSLIVRLANDTANAALESASLKTDAPTGGTAATWKLGTVATVTPTLQNRTIEVDIGGTIYYISAKTTND